MTTTSNTKLAMKPRLQFQTRALLVFLTVSAVGLALWPVVAKHYSQWRADADVHAEVETYLANAYSSSTPESQVQQLRLLEEIVNQRETELSPISFERLSGRIEAAIEEMKRGGELRAIERAEQKVHGFTPS